MPANTPVVLIVEDELELADLYRDWLSDEYTVRIAATGAEAMDKIDSAIDVAILDRQVPDKSGDEILHAIEDRGYSCQAIMVTAVEPDFDIIPLPFDEYLTKPISCAELVETVDRVRALGEIDEDILKYYGLASKIGLLNAHKPEYALNANAQYQRLLERFVRVKERANRNLRKLVEELPADWVSKRLLEVDAS